MSHDFTFGNLIHEGSIIDNRRVFLDSRITLKDVLKKLAEGSQGFKSAVGYFYIEGLSEIVYSLQQLKDIKILMGGETTPKTKKELIKAFKERFDQIEENEITIPAIAMFHRLVKEAKILDVALLEYIVNDHTPNVDLQSVLNSYLVSGDVETVIVEIKDGKYRGTYTKERIV